MTAPMDAAARTCEALLQASAEKGGTLRKIEIEGQSVLEFVSRSKMSWTGWLGNCMKFSRISSPQDVANLVNDKVMSRGIRRCLLAQKVNGRKNIDISISALLDDIEFAATKQSRQILRNQFKLGEPLKKAKKVTGLGKGILFTEKAKEDWKTVLEKAGKETNYEEKIGLVKEAFSYILCSDGNKSYDELLKEGIGVLLKVDMLMTEIFTSFCSGREAVEVLPRFIPVLVEALSENPEGRTEKLVEGLKACCTEEVLLEEIANVLIPPDTSAERLRVVLPGFLRIMPLYSKGAEVLVPILRRYNENEFPYFKSAITLLERIKDNDQDVCFLVLPALNKALVDSQDNIKDYFTGTLKTYETYKDETLDGQQKAKPAEIVLGKLLGEETVTCEDIERFFFRVDDGNTNFRMIKYMLRSCVLSKEPIKTFQKVLTFVQQFELVAPLKTLVDDAQILSQVVVSEDKQKNVRKLLTNVLEGAFQTKGRSIALVEYSPVLSHAAFLFGQGEGVPDITGDVGKNCENIKKQATEILQKLRGEMQKKASNNTLMESQGAYKHAFIGVLSKVLSTGSEINTGILPLVKTVFLEDGDESVAHIKQALQEMKKQDEKGFRSGDYSGAFYDKLLPKLVS